MQEQPKKSYFRELAFGRHARRSFYVLTGCFGVFLLFLLFTPYLAMHVSASQYANATVKWGSVSLTLDPDYDTTNPAGSQAAVEVEGHGDILFGELVPTENNLDQSGNSYGTLKVLKKTIGITSSGKYYSVYLSTATSDNNLSLELSGGSKNSSIRIPALSSTFASPASFSGTGWGYAVPGVDTDSDAIPDAPSTYIVPAVLDTQIGAQTEIAGAASTYNNTKWSGVPNSSAPQLIWKAHAHGSAGENYGFGAYTNDQSVPVVGDTTYNHFDIYYAVAVDTDVLAGTYSNNIVYTALASASSLDSVSRNLMVDRNFGGYKDVETIHFDLSQSTTAISESDITVKLVPHSLMLEKNYLDKQRFQISDLTDDDDAMAQMLDCTVVPNTLTVTTYAEFECILPSQRPETGNGESTYDFWVNVDGYNYNYISVTRYGDAAIEDNNPAVGTFIYSGLQTEYPTYTYTDAYTDPSNPTTVTVADARKATDKKIVTEMQQMTNGICNNTNAWGNTSFLDTSGGEPEEWKVGNTGAHARVYDYTGNGNQLVADGVSDEATLQANAAIGVGTFALTDTRDSKTYLVRRLADGNCWMVQNLDLNLNQFGAANPTGAKSNLTSTNTDVSEDWDPFASTNSKISTYSSSLSSQDFAGLSNFLLGQTQTYQYQPQGTNGSTYYWGSKKSDDGEWTELSEVVNNANSEIPRSYSNTKANGNIMYISTNGLVGTTVTGEGDAIPSSGDKDADDWDSTNNQFYGSEYFGQYYNWYAAVAETRGYTSGEASGSICPKGWQLPVNASTGVGGKSWMDLIKNTYTLITASGTQGIGEGKSTAFPDSANPDKEAAWRMHQIPLSIPFTGLYNWTNGVLYDRGSDGSFWSSTASSPAYTYYLYFYGTSVSPQNGYHKVNGFSVRCVAHGSEIESEEAQEVIAASTCSSGKICYDGNGGSMPSGSGKTKMDDQTAAAGASNITLKAPEYTRAGFAFAGWSTQNNGFGKVYGPNETITVPSQSDLGTGKGYQLYAKWLPSTGTMQDFNAAACSNLGMEQTIALTDNRDGKVYTVAKLRDGNCWMTSNLALNLADFAGTHNLTPANTDLTSITAVSRGYWDPGESTSEEFAPAWGSYLNEKYFNWLAATAGSGAYDSSNKAEDSVCPLGWQLPVGDDTSSPETKSWTDLLRDNYSIANDATGSRLLRDTPVLGMYYSGSIVDLDTDVRSSGGTFWCSNSWRNNGYALNFNDSTVSPASAGNDKVARGLSIRCVQK